MIFNKLQALNLSTKLATLLTGLIFGVHHFILVVPIAGFGVGVLTFVVLTAVSCVWSVLYQKYNSLSSPYLTHVLADLALFVVGFDALFGK